MATISMLKKDLIDESGVASPENVIPAIGMEVEREDGGEITVDITPNRPDLLDITGLARELALHSGLRKPRRYGIKGSSGMSISVGRGVKSIRPFIAGLVVKKANLNGDNLKYLINFSEKLSATLGRNRKKLAIGIHDLSAINGNLRYDAANDGRIFPLNYGGEISFKEVMGKHDKGIEYSFTVMTKAGKQLFPYLADSEKTISLIPITNCNQTKITTSTESLFIDITGTDEFTVSKVADIFACSFIDRGFDVYSVSVETDSGKKELPKLSERKIKAKPNGLYGIIGYKPENIKFASLCLRAGYIASETKGGFNLIIPPYRYDVFNDQDVYEDLLFAYGYDEVKTLPVSSINPGGVSSSSELEERLTEVMLGLGYTEAYNNHLANEKTEFANMGKDFDQGSVVKIKYAKTENISIMRDSLLPGLLQNLADSSSEQMPYKIFEIGKVFGVAGGKPLEERFVAFVSEHSKADFAEAKASVLAFLKSIGVEPELENSSASYFITGRCASITVKGKQVGLFGEIHPKVLKNFGIEEPVVACEISIDRIQAKAQA